MNVFLQQVVNGLSIVVIYASCQLAILVYSIMNFLILHMAELL